MGSADRLPKWKIWVNFIVNRSKGSVNIEGTPKCWVDLMALKCDLDLVLSEVK